MKIVIKSTCTNKSHEFDIREGDNFTGWNRFPFNAERQLKSLLCLTKRDLTFPGFLPYKVQGDVLTFKSVAQVTMGLESTITAEIIRNTCVETQTMV